MGAKLAELAVLFSQQILNGSQDVFISLYTLIFIFFKYETIETHTRTFLTLNIFVIGRGIGQKEPVIHYAEKTGSRSFWVYATVSGPVGR